MVQVIHKVLAVDDEEALLHGYRRGFSKTHQVFTAQSAAEALTIAGSEQPELVVVDLRIGQDWGLEVIRELRKVVPNAILVMVSGFLSVPATVDAMKAGADHVIAKPTTAARILREVSGRRRPIQPGEEAMPSLAMTQWEHINRAMAESSGNISEAARRLGIRRTSLQRKLKKRPPPK